MFALKLIPFDPGDFNRRKQDSKNERGRNIVNQKEDSIE